MTKTTMPTTTTNTDTTTTSNFARHQAGACKEERIQSSSGKGLSQMQPLQLHTLHLKGPKELSGRNVHFLQASTAYYRGPNN